ncbi:MAG: radical SAM protein [candidate division Zixibacteria bacterium]|nr:radical SAM protein [candidate division Zixibacteria bacterium]
MGLKSSLIRTVSRYTPTRRWLRDAFVQRKLVFPQVVSIESSSHCNADCIMCPREQLTRTKGNMSMDLYRKVIDECARHKRYVRLIQPFMFGEPFINKRLVEMIRYAKEKLPRTPINVSTNGSLLYPAKAQELIDVGLDKINIDIDGATKETFEAVRIGLDYEEVVENARHLMGLKKRLGLRKPEITVTIIQMEPTEGEIEAFVELWKPAADHVVVQRYTTWTGSVEDRNTGEIAEASAAGGFTFPCKHPWEEFVIAHDGKVSLCCLDFDFKIVVGDVNTQSIREIWNGAPLEEVRRRMIDNRYHELELCSQCNNHIFQTACTWHYLWSGPDVSAGPTR